MSGQDLGYIPLNTINSFDPDATFGSFPTLSGGTVSGCKVYAAVIGAAAKIGQDVVKNIAPSSLAALLYEIEAGFGIIMTAGELSILLGVVLALGVAGAVFC